MSHAAHLPDADGYPSDARPALLVRDQIRARLSSLSYAALCLLVRHLLYRSGYSSVHAVGRLFRPDALPKGREVPAADEGFDARRFNPHHGGLDLIALSHTDLATSLTLVQVKQYKAPVPRRFIDELRGAMLRLGAEQGLLLTTSHFSPLAQDAAGETHLRPVRLVDGAFLTQLLLVRRIGLRRESGGSENRWVFDAGFFNELEERVRRMEGGGLDQINDRQFSETGEPLAKRSGEVLGE